MIDALGSGRGARMLTRDVIGSGPRWICGILESRGVDCHIQLCEDFLRRGDLSEVDLLMVSAMTMDLAALKNIGRTARTARRDCIKVVGGPACGQPQRVLDVSGFDLAISGEGERAVESILDGAGYDDIPGLSYRQGDRAVIKPPAPRLDEESYNRYVPSVGRIRDYATFFASRVYVEVVRGCSNFRRTRMPLSDGRACSDCSQGCGGPDCPEHIPPGCGFCSVPATFGPPKSRHIGLVADEIRGLVELGVRRIVLSAPDFLDYCRGKDTTNPRRPAPNHDKLEALLEASKEAAGGRAYVSIENVKPSLFDEPTAALIARHLPGTEIHIGCETGDEAHSRALGRPSTPKEATEAVRIARSKGLKPYVYFIHGLPGQTMKSAARTSRMIRRMQKDAEKITIYRFKALPGSAFEKEASGPPGHSEPGSAMMVQAAREINMAKKDEYIGKVIDAIAAERNLRRRGQIVCYPAELGPVITVPGSAKLIGRRLRVRVDRAVTDGLLKGVVVEVLA